MTQYNDCAKLVFTNGKCLYIPNFQDVTNAIKIDIANPMSQSASTYLTFDKASEADPNTFFDLDEWHQTLHTAMLRHHQIAYLIQYPINNKELN